MKNLSYRNWVTYFLVSLIILFCFVFIGTVDEPIENIWFNIGLIISAVNLFYCIYIGTFPEPDKC